MSAVIDLTGAVFGRLTVTWRAGSCVYDDGLCTRAAWRCRCSCGREVVVDGQSLRRGLTKSRGCLRSEMTRARFRKRREEARQ